MTHLLFRKENVAESDRNEEWEGFNAEILLVHPQQLDR